jgi:hypothetical protein
MIIAGTCKSYIQRMNAYLRSARSIIAHTELDTQVPAKQMAAAKNETWVIGRGDEYYAVTRDERGEQPYSLLPQGRMHLFVRIKRKAIDDTEGVEAVAYNLKFMDLCDNDNKVTSLRFDRSSGKPGWNWDETLQENVEHPWQHLHVNFHHSVLANDLRLITGFVCPIVAITNFAHWYHSYSK